MAPGSNSLCASIRRRQREGAMPVLSEIKCRSPRDGDLLRGRDPLALAKVMAAEAIAGLSVVTEEAWFGGSLEILRAVGPVAGVPILRKDFIAKPAQMAETAKAGASAVLLIVQQLDADRLRLLQAEAHRCGLETVVEVHSEADWQTLVDSGIGPDVVGVNNRNIAVGETDEADVTVTEQLAPLARGKTLLLSESSLRDAADVRRAREAGADAVLVGTSILLAEDAGVLLRSMVAVGWRA
ncbi:MAG: indole-3-glycerol-phosphate synthase [Gemmataceae bacterium]|nr:indole-3-glycerol-phosphate synthase [Gemmataceae bacterium]